MNQEQTQTDPSAAERRILVVDDSRTMRMMEKMILKQGSYRVETADTGRAAVEAAKSDPPDLILMDVMMPELDGIGATKELRSHDATAGIPVILVTTKGEEEFIRRGFEAGCDAYVTKPIDPVDLLGKIEALLGGGSPSALARASSLVAPAETHRSTEGTEGESGHEEDPYRR